MAEREVKLAGMTYMNEAGLAGQFGLQGQKVKVHADDLERFDELNEQPGGDEPHDPQQESVDMLKGGGTEKPEPKKAAAKK